MEYVRLVDNDIDADLLRVEVFQILNSHSLLNKQQISLTSITGDDDWDAGVGKIANLPKPERLYSTVMRSLKGTYIEECIRRYSEYYRWRLLKLEGHQTYSVHYDGDGVNQNFRLHIPVVTNPESFLCFFNQRPATGESLTVHHEHLAAGNSYRVNTTHYHPAVNYGIQDRYHIVGVRYENSNNRSQ